MVEDVNGPEGVGNSQIDREKKIGKKSFRVLFRIRVSDVKPKKNI